MSGYNFQINCIFLCGDLFTLMMQCSFHLSLHCLYRYPIRLFSVHKGLSELTDRCEITEGSWLQLKGYKSYLMVCLSDSGF